MINTGINTSLLRPQTFHVIVYLLGSRVLASLPQRVCIIGPQASTGTAVANVVIDVADPGQVDTLFGIGSVVSLMCRKAFETAGMLGQGPAIAVCPLAETTTKRAQTLTFTGPATEDKDVIIRIAGRYIVVGIANGTSATNIALAVSNKILSLKQILPVTSAPAAGVVTATDATKGVLGNDVLIETVQLPAGVTLAIAQTVAGAGVLAIQPALDAIAGQDFDAIAVCNHAAQDITDINAHIASTWTASEKRPRWFFLGEPGTIGTATALSAAANHEGVLIGSWELSRSMPCEIATALAILACSKTRPNATFNGAKLPLYPPPIAAVYTNAEIETALNAGLTPLTAIVDRPRQTVIEGVGAVVRLITTRTTKDGVNFGLLRDFGVSRTTWYMAKQYDIRFAQQFGADANPDGVMMDDETQRKLRDMVINLNYAAQDIKILRNVDKDKDLIVVEPDAQASGRLNVDSSYTIRTGLYQVAYVHRAYQ